MRLRLLLHGGSPCCTQRPDWIVRDDGGAWVAVDVSHHNPVRSPWWSMEGRWQPLRAAAVGARAVGSTVEASIAAEHLDGLGYPLRTAGELRAALLS